MCHDVPERPQQKDGIMSMSLIGEKLLKDVDDIGRNMQIEIDDVSVRTIANAVYEVSLHCKSLEEQINQMSEIIDHLRGQG